MEQKQTLFFHILVPTDGSQASLSAGRLAIQMARQQQAKITFVSVVDSNVTEELSRKMKKTVSQTQAELANKADQYLKHLVHLAEGEDLNSEQITCYGLPYIEIEKLVREKNIDLVIMGQTSHSGSRRMLIGSVAQRVIENAPCPVLVVK